MNNDESDIELLPHWATGKSDGEYMQVGAQLETRDGRTIGNAYVNELRGSTHTGEKVAEVISDMGTKFVMTEDELKEQFYPPRYVMDCTEAYHKRVILKGGEE